MAVGSPGYAMRFRPIEWLLAGLLLTGLPAWGQELRLLVQSVPLAGFQYHAGEALWETLRVGDALELVREADNPYDARAVRVDWRGIKLGYLPRVANRAVAEELDRGGRLEARIAALTKARNPWQRIRIEVWAPL